MKHINYKHKTIVGILDSDGGFTLRVLKRKDKKVGFSVLVSFTQQSSNVDVLEPIARELKANTLLSFVDSKGRHTSRLDINFNTEPGQRLLKILKKYPPRSPGKLRDFLISQKIFEFAQKRSYECLPGPCTAGLLSPASKEKVGSIAAIFLMDNMVNQSQRPTALRRKKSADSWYQYLGPTPQELNLGLELGKKFLQEIEDREAYWKQLLTGLLTYKEHVKKCSISSAYLIGFYIADGSFQLNWMLPPPYKKLQVSPAFTLSECEYGSDFLRGVKSIFGYGTVGRTAAQGLRFKVTGWKRCTEDIIPMFSNYILPAARQRQFNTFVKLCIMGVNGVHLTREGAIKMVELSWAMNESGAGRLLTKEEFLYNLNVYFNYQESKRKLRSTLHVTLRKKFCNTKGKILAIRPRVKPLPLSFKTF